jgi:anti-sigma factor RsiW
LIHGHVDGELDLVRSLEVEQHLRECAACSQAAQGLQSLGDSLRAQSMYYRAGPRLKSRIQRALRQEAAIKRPRRAVPWLGLAIAASVAAAVLLTWSLLTWRLGNDRLVQEILASHTRSVLAVHKVDVVSSDRHMIKPWLNDKLGFSPDVVDLADPEFPLLGARLDYVDNQPVAALVYTHGKHLINLYIWPATREGDTDVKTASKRGYHLYHWRKAGMNYWAVSDVNKETLSRFVQRFRE